MVDGKVELHMLHAFLAVAGIVGLLAGAVLVIRPDWMVQLGRYANRWISTRQFDSPMERSFNVDKWFYQHHRTAGTLMLAGACWTIAYFITVFDKFRALAALGHLVSWPRGLLSGLLDATVLLALVGSVFAALVSLFLLLRPSMLREFEQGADRWISTRQALKPLEIPRDWPDSYVLHHSRAIGLLSLLASLFMLGMLAIWYG